MGLVLHVSVNAQKLAITTVQGVIIKKLSLLLFQIFFAGGLVIASRENKRLVGILHYVIKAVITMVRIVSSLLHL